MTSSCTYEATYSTWGACSPSGFETGTNVTSCLRSDNTYVNGSNCPQTGTRECTYVPDFCPATVVGRWPSSWGGQKNVGTVVAGGDSVALMCNKYIQQNRTALRAEATKWVCYSDNSAHNPAKVFLWKVGTTTSATSNASKYTASVCTIP